MFGFFKIFFGSESDDSHFNTSLLTAMDGLDIQTAMVAHENWKVRLQAYLNGSSSEKFLPEVICFDNHCDLGQWIHGNGQLHMGKFPGFVSLLEHHKMFHYAASNVVALSQAGKEADAHKMLDGQFATFSKAVAADLEGMHYAVEHSKARKHG